MGNLNQKGGAIALLKRMQKLIILLIFALVLTLAAPKSFPTAQNISNVLWSVSTIGIMATGSIFVILLGGIDLSLGSIMAMSGVISVGTIRYFEYSTMGAVVGIGLALAMGLLVGLFHGVIITRFRVPAFLITFATQIILSGLAQRLLNNKILSCLEPALFIAIGKQKIFGFPLPIYFMFIAMLISFYVLNKTRFGRNIYAVGGNAEAANLSGINSNRMTISAYMISGLTAAVAGIVLSSMTQQAMASAGSGYETEVITAIVIGGASLMGGEGNVTGAIFGALLVGLLNNGLNLLDVPATVHPFVKGLIIVAAVAFDTLSKEGGGQKLLSRFRFKTTEKG